MRAIRSVLKPGGRHCFYVIATRSDLTDAGRRRLAKRDGNEHVESQTPYDELMESAGFTDIAVNDVSDAFLETQRCWSQEWESDARALIDLLGEDEFSRRIRNRRLDIASVEDGLLLRLRVTGSRPRGPELRS